MDKNTDKIDISWHLAKNDVELQLVNFEFLFWRTYYNCIRWQEDCQSCIADDHLTAHEIAILHIIRMKERPKSIYEIGRLLNRDDTPNIQYGIKKLIALNYIRKVDVKSDKMKKAIAYQITEEGIKNTDAYTQARNNILLNIIKEYNQNELQFEEAKKTLFTMKGLYEEASRLVASFKTDS